MSKFKLNKTVLEVDINGEDYIATVDMTTIVHYKKNNKESFLMATQRVSDMDEETIIKLLGSIIRKSDKSEPVGFKFFKDFNPIAIVEAFTPVLVEALGVNMPEAENEEEKK